VRLDDEASGVFSCPRPEDHPVLDHHYVHPRLARLYDLDSGWSDERDFYVHFASPTAHSVLDIGCGTGLIARRLASLGHHVVGADPAHAMLECGRAGAHGDLVEWVESTAQELELGRRFDRIIMTGNAFQVLHSTVDLRAAFAAMREHLAPDGRVAFETRNPGLDWSQSWDYELTLSLDTGEQVTERRRLLEYDGTWLRFELTYAFPDETLRSESTLRFWGPGELHAHLSEAGLRADRVLGDWEGPVREGTREMVFIVAHAVC